MSNPGQNVEIKYIPTKDVNHAVDLINNIYSISEVELWKGTSKRTNEIDMLKLIAANQMVGAYVNQNLVGCARSEKLNEEVDSFGMLAVENSPLIRGTGLGRALFKFMEDDSRQKGVKRIQLDILKPRNWLYPPKEFLDTWYKKLGYAKVGVRPVEEIFTPEKLNLLATPCELAVYMKEL